MKRGITQKDIARRLGVSQALVSRALAGTAEQIDASPETVARIRSAAAECNYRPSAAALTLKGRPTRTLGVAIKAFDDPFLGNMIGELQGLARGEGYALLLAGWDDPERSYAGVELFHRYRIDGLVICGSDSPPPLAAPFVAEGRPVVQIGSGRAGRGVCQVAFDEERGLYDLAAYLLGLGHRRIGFAGGTTPAQARRERWIRRILPALGLEVQSGAFVRFGLDTAAEVVRQIAASDPRKRPTALIAGDDALAQALMRAAHEQGLRVPEALSLAGVDDIPAARQMIPALTTVRQPVGAMVRQAFAMVTGQGTETAARSIPPVVIKANLVVRESCAAPAGMNTTAG